MSAWSHQNCRKIYSLSRAALSIWVAWAIYVPKSLQGWMLCTIFSQFVPRLSVPWIYNSHRELPLLFASFQCFTSAASVMFFPFPPQYVKSERLNRPEPPSKSLGRCLPQAKVLPRAGDWVCTVMQTFSWRAVLNRCNKAQGMHFRAIRE